MVPGVVPTGAVPGASTPPDRATTVPGWPGTTVPAAPGVATVPGAPGTVPGAPAPAPGTVVWAKAVLLRPRLSRAAKINLEEFIIGG